VLQVREQERFIARQLRRQVQERRQQHVQTLADSLQIQWQQQQTLKLQALTTQYQHSLRSVGLGQSSAREHVSHGLMQLSVKHALCSRG